MRTSLLALLLTLGSLNLHGQAPDCQFTQTFTSTGYGDTISNQAVANLSAQCTTWRLSYYADGMTSLSIQIEGAPDSNGSSGSFASVPTTACSSTQQPPCLIDGTNPLTNAYNGTEAFRGYYAWIALHVTVFVPTGSSGLITARMYGYKGSSASAGSGGSGGGFANPMTALGDLIYGSTAGAPARVPGNTTNVPKVLTETGDGTNSAEPQWSVISSGGLLYYFTPTASDLSSDLQMTAATYSPITTLGPLAVINGTQTIETWATNAASPGLNFIPAGIYVVHLHYSRSPAPIGTIQLQAILEEVDATGSFIGTIGTTELSPIINPQGGQQEADLAFADSNVYTLASTTSRILVLVQAVSTSATPTVSLYVGGTADAHLFLPASPTGGNFVPYNGATGPVALGSYGITGAPFTGDSGSGGTTGLVPAPASGDAAAGKYLAAGGSWTAPPAGGITALTGDVTASGSGSVASTIAAAHVAPSMMKASTFDGQVDGAPVTWAIGSVLNAQATLTFTVHSGSRTLNITNPVIGGNYVLKLIQDATGGEGLTLGTGCTWKVVNGGAGAVTLTNAANALDVLTFVYDGTNCLTTLLANLN